MILIGSYAIQSHFRDFPRLPKDMDYAVFEITDEMKSNRNVEFLYNPVIGHEQGIASPNMLYTLKISHIVGWDIQWEKHMFDIQFLKEKGCKLDMDLFKQLYGFWNTIHKPNKRSDLDMTSDDFFNNALTTKYPHDYIHTILNPTPTYTKILKDGKDVDVSEEKFNQLSFEEKCDLVREEVEVMSWERYQDLSFRIAYSKMLKKFTIHHAPIWEAIFIIENYIELHKNKRNHFKLINEHLLLNS